jgi:hypothetical protein
MAILRLRPSDPCIFAIFKTTNFKFWILIENSITTNDTMGFIVSSSGIELDLGPSRIIVLDQNPKFEVCRFDT